MQRISFLGMELDSVNLTAHLSVDHAQSMLNCLESFQRKRAVPLKHFQRLLGHMAAAVTPLGLLHMRPLQRWLHDRVPRWTWQHCDCCVHQPPRWPTLPSHVPTRPPSPPLESEASEVSSRRSCPRRAQSGSR